MYVELEAEDMPAVLAALAVGIGHLDEEEEIAARRVLRSLTLALLNHDPKEG